MQVKTTATTLGRTLVAAPVSVPPANVAAVDPAVLRVAASLTYGELAVALYASDMPTARRQHVDTEQAWMFVVQGIERLGVELIRQLDRRSRALILATDLDAYVRLWPSGRRADRAHGLAFRLRRL